MNSLPVRLFHAYLSGTLLVVVAALSVLHIKSGLRAATIFRGHGAGAYVPQSAMGTANPTYPVTGDDEDGDGIPDDWEISHSHSKFLADDAAFDFDFDGLTRKQEHELFLLTDGAYGNPLGNFELLDVAPPAGYSLINSTTLIETARNGRPFQALDVQRQRHRFPADREKGMG